MRQDTGEGHGRVMGACHRLLAGEPFETGLWRRGQERTPRSRRVATGNLPGGGMERAGQEILFEGSSSARMRDRT